MVEFALRPEHLLLLIIIFLTSISSIEFEYRAIFPDNGASDIELHIYGNPTEVRYWTNYDSGTISVNSTLLNPIKSYQRFSGTTVHFGGAISIKVSSNDDVTLIGIARGKTGGDAFRIFEKTHLAGEFVAMTFYDVTGISQIAITSFEDANERMPIQITLPGRRCFSNPTCSVTYNGVVYNDTNNVITVTLNSMDVFHLHAECDLTGTLIRSGMPIAVFSGSHSNQVGFYSTKAFMIEQLIPTAYWGNEYIVYPYPDSFNGDIICILAYAEQTEVRIVGYGNYLITKARQFIHRRINNDRAVQIWASKKISVVQYIIGQANEPCSMVTVQPIANYVDKVLTHVFFETYLIAKTKEIILYNASVISSTVLKGDKKVMKSEYVSGKVGEQTVYADYVVKSSIDDRIGGYMVSTDSGNMLMATSCGYNFELPVSSSNNLE